MRVSTGMIFDTGLSSIQRQTATLLHTQQQVATGRRIVTPADDPVSAARALEVTQARDINAQYRANQDNARTALGLVESHLAQLGELMQSVRERAVQAGNGALADSDRAALAADLRARFGEMLGIANSTDGTGLYLFAGYQGQTAPFSGTVEGGVTYAGDDGRRALQVSASRQLPVSDPGSEVFQRVRTSAGTTESLFDIVSRLILALEDPVTAATGGQTRIANEVSRALDGLSQGLDEVLTVRASVGSRLSELDALSDVSEDLNLQYESTLSRLQDVDLAEAISDLTQQQTYLEAAQKSFLRVTGLSLFNFI
jgi:flagellar hook-associated protein 3 FlgL